MSREEQKAGINTAEASQPGSIWPLDPSLPRGALGWPLAGAKLITGLWPGVGLLQLGDLGQGCLSHHQWGAAAPDTSLLLPQILTAGAQGSAGTLNLCLGAGPGNLKVLCQKVQS